MQSLQRWDIQTRSKYTLETCSKFKKIRVRRYDVVIDISTNDFVTVLRRECRYFRRIVFDVPLYHEQITNTVKRSVLSKKKSCNEYR